MNQRLQELYKSKWESLCTAMQPLLADETLEAKPACPLLLSIDDEADFKNADIRVIFYGQETFGWNDTFNNEMQSTINYYNQFFNEGEWKQRAGAFWNGVARFMDLLQKKYPDKKIRFIWNNVVKIGKAYDKGYPPDEIYETELKHFPVFKEELKIIQPTIVVFFTGPYYDSVIDDKFGKRSYTYLSPDFEARQLASVAISGVPFAFRTYHPNYLWRNDIDSYFQPIIEKIDINSTNNIYLKSLDQLKEDLQKAQATKIKLVAEKQYEASARVRDEELALLEAIEFKSPFGG